MKTCTKCGETKDFSEFHKLVKSKDGHKPECKSCVNERRIKKRQQLKDSPIEQMETLIRSCVMTENKMLFREGKKLCSSCKNIFLIVDLTGFYCKKCSSSRSKEYLEKNSQKIKEYKDSYREKNREKLNEAQKQQYHKKTKEEVREYREKIKEYQSQYHEKNKEKIKEKIKEYREKNKEKIIEKNKEYREKNREKIKERQRQYRLKQKEGN